MDWNQMHRGQWCAADTRLWTAFGFEARDFALEMINNEEYVRRLVFFAKHTNPYLALTPIDTVELENVRGCRAASEAFPGNNPKFDADNSIRYGMFNDQPALPRVTATIARTSVPAQGIEVAAVALGLDASTNISTISRLMLTLGHVATLPLVMELCKHAEGSSFADHTRRNSATDKDFHFFFMNSEGGVSMGRAYRSQLEFAPWILRAGSGEFHRHDRWWDKDSSHVGMNVLLCNWEPPVLTAER